MELGEHLVGIAHNRRAAAGTRAADTGPEIVLGIAIACRRLAWFGLAANARRLGAKRAGADRVALRSIEVREQAVGGGAGLSEGALIRLIIYIM